MAKAKQYIEAQQYNRCTDIDSAIALIKMITSQEAQGWSAASRRMVGGSIIGFLCEYESYVKRVEDGCKALLLQAAEMVGRNGHDIAREDPDRPGADRGVPRGGVLERMAGWLEERADQVGSEDAGGGDQGRNRARASAKRERPSINGGS